MPTAAKCFACSEHFWQSTRSLTFETSCRSKMSFCSARISESWCDTRVAFDDFCLFLCIIIDQIVNHCWFVWRIQDLLCQAGDKKCLFLTFSRLVYVILLVDLICAVEGSLSNKTSTDKGTTLVQRVHRHVVVQNSSALLLSWNTKFSFWACRRLKQ